MKTSALLFSLLVLTVLPIFTSQAFIEKPAQQFKTLAEIQADARASLTIAASDPQVQRRQRLQQLTRKQNSGVSRVKSAKLNFKKRLGNNKNVRRSFRSTASNLRFAHKNQQKQAARTAIKKSISARNSSSKRRSSFEFVPQPGQIWGR